MVREAEAGIVEDELDHENTAQKHRELHAQQVQQRHRRVLQRMAEDDLVARQPSHPGDVDEGLAHHARDRDGQGADDEGRDLDRQHQRRQDRVGKAAIADGGQQVQLHRQKQRQNDPEPEVGQAHEERRGIERQPVGQPPGIEPAPDADGHPHHEREHHGQHRELQRHRRGFGDQVQHLGPLAAGGVVEARPAHGRTAGRPHEGLSQIALQHLPHVAAELDVDRIAQPHLGRDLLDQRVGGHASHHQPDRIARNDAQQGEDQGRDQKDDDRALPQSPREES